MKKGNQKGIIIWKASKGQKDIMIWKKGKQKGIMIWKKGRQKAQGDIIMKKGS